MIKTNMVKYHSDIEQLNEIYECIKQTDEYTFLIKGFIPSLSYSPEQIASYLSTDKYEAILLAIEKDNALIKECYGIINLFLSSVSGALNDIKLSQHDETANHDPSPQHAIRVLIDDLLTYKNSFMKISYERVTFLIHSCEAKIAMIETPVKNIIAERETEKKRLEDEKTANARISVLKKTAFFNTAKQRKRIHELANKFRDQELTQALNSTFLSTH